MASSSLTSSTGKRFKYDVFVSLCDKDIPQSFVSHLYAALHEQGIKTFNDDVIRTGRVMNAIEDSRCSIVVFSKNYASSSWCLNELVKIMECRNTPTQIAIRLYYDVGPKEVREQSGTVGEAFAKHEKKEAAGKWRRALRKGADLAGWFLNTAYGDEDKLIRRIVKDITQFVASVNWMDENLVGMETRMKNVMSSLKSGFDVVHMIGIMGMGGAGKTTLARAIFDSLSFEFQDKSFVENVSEVSKGSLSGLKSLQEKIFSDLLDSVYDRQHISVLRQKKVLVVLDDVDHIDQLKVLTGEIIRFQPGSRIIITTRDGQVLRAHRVNFIHRVNLLEHDEAICLFSRYAFHREIPIQGYEELSGQVVRCAAGLPLTIRVLGSFLCGRDKIEWMDTLERLKVNPLRGTLEKLELSYNGLENDYKEIFLDVACFLKGKRKDDAIRRLESCGFNARVGLRILEQKCLITVKGSNEEFIDIHDCIEEMGKNIVRRLHPNEPYRHSRLWNQKEIEDILANDLGTEATTAIAVDRPVKLSSEIITKGFGSMKQLRLLCMISEIDDNWDVKVDKVRQNFPCALRYLSWDFYPHWSLPKTFQANYLVTLELPHSRIVQLWENGEEKVLNELRFLNLSNSSLRTLDVGLAPNLEELKLEECRYLVELHMPAEFLKLRSMSLSHPMLGTLNVGLAPNLEELKLEACGSLRTLNVGLTPKLEVLKIRNCSFLVEFRMPTECLKLRSLKLRYLQMRTLDLLLTPNLEVLKIEDLYELVELRMPTEFVNLRSLTLSNLKIKTLDLVLAPNLEMLKIYKCFELRSLNLSHLRLRTFELCEVRNLEVLKIADCHDLVELQIPPKFPVLRSLELSHLKLKALEILLAPNLEVLKLQECHDLVELRMPTEFLKLTSLTLSHLELETLDLRLTTNLERLDLQDCNHLKELHTPSEGLERLVFLNLSGCSRINSFLFIKKLESLEFLFLNRLYLKELPDIIPRHCDNSVRKFSFRYNDIDKLPSSIANLQKLVYLDLHSCRRLTSLPQGICGLQHLRNLKLYGCSLKELPEEINHLKCLEKLNLSFSRLKTLPDNICMLKHLQSLNLSSCWNLEKLPEDLGGLECLQNLVLTECIQLRYIPDSICELKHLKHFSVLGCIELEKLPTNLGQLECLEVLNLKGTLIRHLPRSISLLKDLKIYEPKSGLRLCDYASASGTLEASSSIKRQKSDPSIPPPQKQPE